MQYILFYNLSLMPYREYIQTAELVTYSLTLDLKVITNPGIPRTYMYGLYKTIIASLPIP